MCGRKINFRSLKSLQLAKNVFREKNNEKVKKRLRAFEKEGYEFSLLVCSAFIEISFLGHPEMSSYLIWIFKNIKY